MKEKKTIKEYFSKVIELVNQIRNLGENLNDKSVCEKILISLSPKYNNITAIIEEIKDLAILSIHN
jgi:gag-polypeptide of LTR copia-type